MSQVRTFNLKELRIVLFGGKIPGKSSVINTVFGKSLLETERRTAQCRKFQGNVLGREVVLVDTPGWWKHFPLSDTAEFLKEELVHGVSLCEPGPHAVLIVTEIDIPFTEKHRKAMEDHLKLLGDQIWTHSLVLFTRGHALGDRSIQEHIEKEGKALQWLVEKCGHTYHVFDNTVPDDNGQVQVLLERIEHMIQRNNGTFFEIDSKILQRSNEWRQNVMARARDMETKVRELQNINKEELRIVMLGGVISGKSSSGDTILNKRQFVTGKRTDKCQRGHGEVCGRPVTVIDTPSWLKYFPSRYTPEWIRSEIFDGFSQKADIPHCILLVIPADTSFKEEQRKIIEENMNMLGEQVWNYTIILFTWGDILGDVTIEQHIESEGDSLKSLVEKCDYRYHVFDNEKREGSDQVKELLQKIDVMMVKAALRCGFMSVCEIKAGSRDEDTASKISDEERNLQDVVRLVDEEWQRRDVAFFEKVSRLKKDKECTNIQGNRSMEAGINFSRSTSDTEVEKTEFTNEVHYKEQESDKNPDIEGEEKHTLKLKDHIKEILDQEWSRREEALMGRVKDMLTDLETSSDPDQNDLERSKRKVNIWLQNQSEISGYASGSDCSNRLDTPSHSEIPVKKKKSLVN